LAYPIEMVGHPYNDAACDSNVHVYRPIELWWRWLVTS